MLETVISFQNPLGIKELIKNGILSSHPQSISTLTHEHYEYIKSHGGIDGRFAFD